MVHGQKNTTTGLVITPVVVFFFSIQLKTVSYMDGFISLRSELLFAPVPLVNTAIPLVPTTKLKVL